MNSGDIVLSTFLAVIPVYLIIGTGWLLRRIHWILPANESPLMRVALDVCYPCLILSSMLGNEKLSSISFSAQAIAMGFTELVVGMGVAWSVARLLKLKVGTGLRTFSLSAGIQNYAFFVIPILMVLFPAKGDPTLGVLMTHNVGCELAVWTIGIIIIAGGVKNLSAGIFLRGPLMAVVIGLLLGWTGLGFYVAVPPVMNTLSMFGGCAVPLCMMLFGCTMYDSWERMQWNLRLNIAGVLTRLVLAPMLILLLAWALPVDPLIKRIMVLQAAIPSAVIPVILAKRFGGHPDIATQVLLVTTLVSFITLPVWLAVGDMFVVPLVP